MMKYKLIKNIIFVTVILSLIQVLLDEYSRFFHSPVYFRNYIIFAGLFFDLFFTIEFLIKIIIACKKKRIIAYWKFGRGWADFFASIPLLILDLPAVILLVLNYSEAGTAAAGFVNILKLIKEMRGVRILHFARILKIFVGIQNNEPAMTRHHISSISVTIACSFICVLVASSFFTPPVEHKIIERGEFYGNAISSIKYLESKSDIPFNNIINKIFADDKNLLKIIHKNQVIEERVSKDRFTEYFNTEDYSAINNRGLILYYSIVDLRGESAFANIIYFLTLIIILLSLRIVYAAHFNRTLRDVIIVINKGFRNRNYNESVKILTEYEEEELFKLAKFYNEAYLPAKLKRISK